MTEQKVDEAAQEDWASARAAELLPIGDWGMLTGTPSDARSTIAAALRSTLAQGRAEGFKQGIEDAASICEKQEGEIRELTDRPNISGMVLRAAVAIVQRDVQRIRGLAAKEQSE